jgi:hypothetical protein
MTWARLDDRANINAKLIALSDGAHRMFSCGLVYCQHNLTDGFIDEAATRTFGVRASLPKVIKELTSVLVPGKKSLWHKVAGGYKVNDFHDWNDPAETVIKKRDDTKERVRRFRERLDQQSGNALHGALPRALQVELQGGLPNAFGARCEQRSKRASISLYQDQERTKEYSGSAAQRVVETVETAEKRRPTAWTVGLAIWHEVREHYPHNPENWSPETKARMLNQGIDANEIGGRSQTKFFQRVHEAGLQQLRFRNGDGGYPAWQYRHRARQDAKRAGRAS